MKDLGCFEFSDLHPFENSSILFDVFAKFKTFLRVMKLSAETAQTDTCIKQACTEHCDVDAQNCCPGMFCEYDIVFQDNRCIPNGMVCDA